MKTHSKYITAIAIPLLAFAVLSMNFGDAYAHKMDVVGDYKIEIGWDEEPPIQGLENSIEVVITYATAEDKKQAEEMDAMMDMGNMDHQMDMGSQNIGAYDEKIIPILNQFDSNKISSSSAISQISAIIKMQTPTNDFDKEVKSLIDDINSGVLTNDDAIYALIDLYGTILPDEMKNQMNMGSMDNQMNMGSMDDHQGGIPGLENSLQITVTLSGNSKTMPLTATDVDGIYLGKFTPISAGYPVVNISGMIHDTKVDLDMHPEEVELLSILSPLKQISHGIAASDVQCKEGLELFMRTHEDSAICASSDLGQRLMELGVVDYY